MTNYIMVTPAKNEEMFLPKVIESICSSNLTPELWVIVDDNSIDNTSNILKDYTKKYDFIEVLSLTEDHPRDLTFHYSYVCKIGFDYVIKIAQKKKIDWEYIALLDADTIVDSNYFNCVIDEMDHNLNIGISSGEVHLLKNGVITFINVLKDIPSGTARVWRKKCFYDTEGYIITCSPDSVSRIKAKLKGWETIRFDKYKAYQLRETSSASGLWKGLIVQGESSYYLNKHPLLVFFTFIYYIARRPYYTGVAFLFGYIRSIFKRSSKIDDEDIQNYWRIRIKELFLLKSLKYK